jgi:hypothetical protein
VDGGPLPADAVIEARLRGTLAVLETGDLRVPE